MKKLKLTIIILVLFPFVNSFSQTIFDLPYTPRDVKFVDYDLDGDNDILIACKDTIVIFNNDGYGNLERIDLPYENGSFIYCSIINNDEFPDIVTVSPEGFVYYLNDSSGSFHPQPYIIPRHTTSMRPVDVVDMDGNGFADIVYYTFLSPYGWGIIYNNGDSTFYDDFIHQTDYVENQLKVGLLDYNDNPDIFVSTAADIPGQYIAYNEEDGFLLDTLFDNSSFWKENEIIDMDNDEDNDLIFFKTILLADTNFLLYKNKSDKKFVDYGRTKKKRGTRVDVTIDLDGDGFQDLACVSWGYDQYLQQMDSIHTFRNNQSWGFELIDQIYIGENSGYTEHIYAGDINGDNYPELFVTGFENPTRSHARLLWNDGTGHFIDTNSVYVGEKNIQFQQKVSVYPNPTSGKLDIRSGTQKIKNIQIMDLKGRILFQDKYFPEQNYLELDLTDNLAKAGLYFCIVQLENDEYVFKKIIVTKP
jgi:hypothetical protein